MYLLQITIKDLESFREMNQSLHILKNRFEDFKSKKNTEESTCYGNSVVFDYSTGYPRPQSVVGFDMKEYEEKYDDFLKRIKKLEEKILFIKKWIEDIEDERTRYVFEAYYVEGKKWGKIASEMGYPEHYPRLYIRDTFLKEKGIKISKN